MAIVFQIILAHVPEILHRKTGDSGKLIPYSAFNFVGLYTATPAMGENARLMTNEN